ncbi:MAG TPA: hypothetical protein DD435_05260 [Cyanobacteria bacterium UBA8530]|nr:hypothetical protein [Cyanobacteria bacterium UBA8530]
MSEAAMTASVIDGERHESIRSEKDPAYSAIKKKLIGMMVSPGIRDIYTMKHGKGNTWNYVVDAEPSTSKLYSPFMEPYDASQDPENLKGLLGPSASKKLYTDEYGVWLSGYAPIRGKDGVARAVVGVDMSAKRVIEEESVLLRMTLWIFLLGLGIAAMASFWMARLLNHPISQLVKGVRLVAAGDLSIRVPEERRDELGELAHSFNTMLGDLARQREELKEQERMSQELATARKIQQAMLPSEAPTSGHFNIDFYAESATEVGGDYFDFLPLEDGQMAIVIGDVTGHGVPAALLMAMVKSCLHTQVLSNYRVSDVMEVANNAVFKSSFDRRLMTFFYSILDTRKGILTFANAGHLYPYLFRASTKEVLSLEVSSYPLGVRPNTTYKEESIKVEDGDILVFYSDGIIEAMNAIKEEFGFDRMEKVIQESGDRSASEIVKELLLRWRTFISEGELQATEDDVTVVVVKMKTKSDELDENLVGKQEVKGIQADPVSLL